MPKCINNILKTYKGNEPSPKGIGYSACSEEIGKIMKGKDDNLWIVKLISNNQKRWYKVKQIPEIDLIEPGAFKGLNNKKSENNITENILSNEFKNLNVKNSFIRNAIYYHVVNELFPNYDYDGYVDLEYDEYQQKIHEYLLENPNIKFGDVLFVGTNNGATPRDEWGFCLVLENNNFSLSTGLNTPAFLMLDNSDLLSNKVSYKEMFEKYKDTNFFMKTFFDNDPDDFEEIRKDFEKNNIW
jgi:hypothetical protein